MQMVKTKKITGKIKVNTGLHIGAGSDTVEIGGMDNPIIRNPLTGEPYIPGSSIKGKMRSLIEWKENRVAKNNGKPCDCGECDVCRVFGVSAGGSGSEEKALRRGPTRLIVRDAVLSEEWREKYANGEQIIESKFENTINRLSGTASNPRPVERVVPGVEFVFELSYRVLDLGDGPDKDIENLMSIVKAGLTLLENDYLGGMGSRGSGRISFLDLKDEEENPIELNGVV
jgi:CRISPR-associated protein Csm3